MFDMAGKRIWVAGHRGMVGREIVRQLLSENCQILTASRRDLDLANQQDVRRWVADNRPDGVFVCAAKVGGILANNSYPADFLYQNLILATNVIEASFSSSVEKLLFLGSSCIYPKFAEQPIREEALLTGPLEPTNEWYAIAKIAGIKLCQAYRQQHGCNFISAMPTNLYGPYDNFDLQTSHVLPALIRKAHEAKRAGAGRMEIWGSGRPRREFLHVNDCAAACIFLMKSYSNGMHVNVGLGEDLTILELAQLVCHAVGFDGELVCDTSKPDGTPRKLMSADKLRMLGWTPTIDLPEGVVDTYHWFLENVA